MRTELLSKTEAAMHSAFDSAGDVLAGAARYHLHSGGSRTRSALAVDAGTALNMDDEDIVAIAACAELLHNASLIHDDIQDGDTTRRGRNAVWVVFGSDVAVTLGDIMITAAYSALARHRATVLPDMLAHAGARVIQTGRGQCADLAAKSSPIKSFAQYTDIAQSKSAPLLALPVELCLISAGRYGELASSAHAVAEFALAYQIVDDISDSQRDAAKSALNAVSVLESELELRDAATEALLRAETLLRSCRASAARLPCGIGSGLDALAVKLLQRVAISSAA